MDLDALPVRNGFRMRGEAVTRLETFVDAAFAFAVTLLVVSFGQIPGTYAELTAALRQTPAFLAGFAILMAFWASHHRFSRRFGLEDGTVTVLSLAMVAVVLVYIFPLRILMSSTMAFFTGGWAPSELQVESLMQLRAIYIIYGAGFLAMALLTAALNAHALRRAGELHLNPVERYTAVAERDANAILAASALLSISLAAFLPMSGPVQQSLPGMSYAVLAVLMPMYGRYAQRRAERLLAQHDAAGG
jgi:uncharacterized membrane protein